jgi:hypothetical protein
MPRYFFHIHEEVAVRDEEGIELADVAAARRQAIAGARDIMSEQVRGGRLGLRNRVDVEDERGDSVFSLAFADAVDIER